MRYYVRERGQDEVNGPYSPEELESRIKGGTLTPEHLALLDTGQTRDQLGNHRDFRWEPISSVPGLEKYTPPVLQEPTHALTEEEQKAAARENMLLGGLWFFLGVLITGVSWIGATESPGGGIIVIAWGAIGLGATQFFRGFLAR